MSMLKDNEPLFLCNGNKVFCRIILLHFFSFLHKFVRLLKEILNCILLIYFLTSLFLHSKIILQNLRPLLHVREN